MHQSDAMYLEGAEGPSCVGFDSSLYVVFPNPARLKKARKSHCRVYPSLCGKKAQTSLPSIGESGKGVFQPLRECLRGVVRRSSLRPSLCSPPLARRSASSAAAAACPHHPRPIVCPRVRVRVRPSISFLLRSDGQTESTINRFAQMKE